MTVIYIDGLFLLNLFLNYGLLLASARVAGTEFRRIRLLAGAAVGGFYAVAIFFPGLAFLSCLPVKVGAGVVMLLCAFGGQRRFFRICLVFLGLSFVLGGGVLALTMAAGQVLYRGVLSTLSDLKTLLLVSTVCYFSVTVFFRRALRHEIRREVVRVNLTVEERTVGFDVLLDTGNTLTDPTGKPVLVAEWQAVRGLFPPEAALSAGDVRDPTAGFARLCRIWDRARLRLMPFRAVGTENGLMLVLRVDELEVEGVCRGRASVAISPGPLTDNSSCRGLLAPVE